MLLSIYKSAKVIKNHKYYDDSDDIENFSFYQNLKDALTQDILMYGRLTSLISLLDFLLQIEPSEVLSIFSNLDIIAQFFPESTF